MEKQKKLKFNLVDVIVLLVVLVGAAFVVLRLSGLSLADLTARPTVPAADEDGDSDKDKDRDRDKDKNKNEEYIITFYTSETADYIVDHLRTGSPLTDDSITLDLGTLVDFETGPARISSAAADGHLVISDKEGYSSVYLMSRVEGKDNGFGITVDGLRLEIGHSMVVRAQEAKFWVYVYDIQELSDTPYAKR